MAQRNPVKFLLNQGAEAKENAVVEGNAFSLTKVLAAGAIIVGPIATVVVDSLQGLKTQQYVVLAIALLGFLAITASADVIGRSIATAAKTRADAAVASIAQMTTFQPPLEAHRVQTGADVAIEVLGTASGGYFLAKEGDSIKWLEASDVRIP